MEVLALRMSLPVLSVLLVALVQRRYGHRLGGRLVGLPLTTGPLLITLLVTDGRDVAARAAVGSLAGQIAVAAFCVAYGALSRRRSPVAALVVATALVAVLLVAVSASRPAPLAVALLVTSVLAGLLIWPPTRASAELPARAPRWDLPVRAVVTGGLVVGLAGLAQPLGPFVAGLLTCVPVVLVIVTPATHVRSGPAAAESLLRGAFRSLPGTTVFLGVLTSTVLVLNPVLSFALASAGLVLADHLVGRFDRHAWTSAAAGAASSAAAPVGATGVRDRVVGAR